MPATVVLGVKDVPLRSYGVASGYEFATLLERCSWRRAVILACAWCARAWTSHRPDSVAGLRHPHLTALPASPCVRSPTPSHSRIHSSAPNLIAATEFPARNSRGGISSWRVPRTVVNGGGAVDGHARGHVSDMILEAAAPARGVVRCAVVENPRSVRPSPPLEHLQAERYYRADHRDRVRRARGAGARRRPRCAIPSGDSISWRSCRRAVRIVVWLATLG